MANGLIGYQFDKMRISPSKDGLLYWGLQNGGQDHIIYGYKSNFLCDIDETGSTITVHPGAAIVGGRLIELQSDQTLSVPPGPGIQAYVYIKVDLTNTNTAYGNTNSTNYKVDNNQISLGIDKYNSGNSSWNSVGMWNASDQLNYTASGFSNTSQKLYIAVFSVRGGTDTNRRSQSGKFTANAGSFLPLDQFISPGWWLGVGSNDPNSSNPLLGTRTNDGAGIYRYGDICYLTCDFIAQREMGQNNNHSEYTIAKIPGKYAKFFMPIGRPSYAIREGAGWNNKGWLIFTYQDDGFTIEYAWPSDFYGNGHVIKKGATLKTQGQMYPALPVNSPGQDTNFFIWN